MPTPSRFNIPDHLRRSATPARSALQRLFGSRGTPVGTPTQARHVPGNNPDDLAGWVQSVRSRVTSALRRDEIMAEELEYETEYARRRREEEIADNSAQHSTAFEKLGNILVNMYSERRKRESDNVVDDQSSKRPKLEDFNVRAELRTEVSVSWVVHLRAH
jgi:hypothetical protein